MTTKQQNNDRIPFESLDDSQPVTAWHLPDMQVEGKRVFKSAKKEKEQNKSKQADEIVEDYDGPVTPKPPTVEDVLKMADEAKKEAYEEGYREGLNKGMADGMAKGQQDGKTQAYNETKQQLSEEIARLTTISDALFEPMEQQQQQFELVMLDMVVNFTKELLQKQIHGSTQFLVDVIHQALSALPVGSKNISVFLNEEDAILVQGHVPKQQRNWIIKVDKHITTGGCRVETLESLVDYTVESRLNSFLEQVRERGDVPAENVAPPDASLFEQAPAESEEDVEAPQEPGNEAKPAQAEMPGSDTDTDANTDKIKKNNDEAQ